MDENTNKQLFCIDELDEQERIVFKRSAGKLLSESTGALSKFYRVLPPGVARYDENKYFLVLCLACKYDACEMKPYQQILRIARSAEADNNGPLDRRIDALMTTAWNDEDGLLALKITQILKLTDKTVIGIRPDFDELYKDLKAWDHPDKYVQRKWARSIFGPINNKKEEN